MIAFLLVSAACLIVFGSLALYLASPNQRLLLRELPRRQLALAGTAMLVVALFLLLQYSGSATSVFILVTGAMLVWTVLPMAVAYWRHGRETAVRENGRAGR